MATKISVDTYVSLIGSQLRTLRNRLAETGSRRKDDAEKVGKLLADWQGKGSSPGRQPEAAHLKEQLLGMEGTEGVIATIDAAMKAGLP